MAKHNESPFVSVLKGMPSYGSQSIFDTAVAVRKMAFAITGMYNKDMVETVKETLVEAMQNNLSYADFYQALKDKFKLKGFDPIENYSYRWDTIYRTNLKRIFERGNYDDMIAISDIYPYREFVAVIDSRTTDICRELDGAVAHFKDPLYLNNQCPRHFNCRSTWLPLSKADPVELAKWRGKNIRSAVGFGQFDDPVNFVEFEDKSLEKVFKEKAKEQAPSLAYKSANDYAKDVPKGDIPTGLKKTIIPALPQVDTDKLKQHFNAEKPLQRKTLEGVYALSVKLQNDIYIYKHEKLTNDFMDKVVAYKMGLFSTNVETFEKEFPDVNDGVVYVLRCKSGTRVVADGDKIVLLPYSKIRNVNVVKHKKLLCVTGEVYNAID